MLDEEYNIKVIDFGEAKWSLHDEESALRKNIIQRKEVLDAQEYSFINEEYNPGFEDGGRLR